MDPVAGLPPILLTAPVASASPGRATLAIAATAMARGTGAGLRIAAGVTTGSLIWSAAAAVGLSALMLSHGWAMEVIRYLGAGYLLWLAVKSARAARTGGAEAAAMPGDALYRRGLLLHLTNPKAIFFFGALYAVMLAPGQSPAALALVVAAVGLQSAVVFLGYGLLFSRPGPMRAYRRFGRWVHGLSALAFGAFGLRLPTARLAQ